MSKKKRWFEDMDWDLFPGKEQNSVSKEMRRQEHLEKAADSERSYWERDESAKKAGYTGIMNVSSATTEAELYGLTTRKKNFLWDTDTTEYSRKEPASKSIDPPEENHDLYDDLEINYSEQIGKMPKISYETRSKYDRGISSDLSDFGFDETDSVIESKEHNEDLDKYGFD